MCFSKIATTTVDVAKNAKTSTTVPTSTTPTSYYYSTAFWEDIHNAGGINIRREQEDKK